MATRVKNKRKSQGGKYFMIDDERKLRTKMYKIRIGDKVWSDNQPSFYIKG